MGGVGFVALLFTLLSRCWRCGDGWVTMGWWILAWRMNVRFGMWSVMIPMQSWEYKSFLAKTRFLILCSVKTLVVLGQIICEHENLKVRILKVVRNYKVEVCVVCRRKSLYQFVWCPNRLGTVLLFCIMKHLSIIKSIESLLPDTHRLYALVIASIISLVLTLLIAEHHHPAQILGVGVQLRHLEDQNSAT